MTEQQFARVRQHVLDAISLVRDTQPQTGTSGAVDILTRALEEIDKLKPLLVGS